MRITRSFRNYQFFFILLCLFLAIISPVQAATQAEINTAIEDGIDWLVPLQGTGGAPAGAWPGDTYLAANSAFAAPSWSITLRK